MDKGYISIKEACELFNKSLSTIRRVVKETPTNKLKKEKLVTGHDKIFIEVEYLKDYFGVVDNKPNDSHTTQNNSSNDIFIEQLKDNIKSKENELKSLQNIITILNNELESKNRQIDALIERQRESNVLVDNLSSKIALETKEVNEVRRKWWQRNK